MVYILYSNKYALGQIDNFINSTCIQQTNDHNYKYINSSQIYKVTMYDIYIEYILAEDTDKGE